MIRLIGNQPKRFDWTQMSADQEEKIRVRKSFPIMSIKYLKRGGNAKDI